MTQIILGYPQIFTNIEFLKLPTLPLGDRSGVVQEAPFDRVTKWLKREQRKKYREEERRKKKEEEPGELLASLGSDDSSEEKESSDEEESEKKGENERNEWSDKDIFEILNPMVKARVDTFKGSKYRCRQHTLAQTTILRDMMKSKVSVDKISLFGVRPPELLFIDKLEWYFKYFERSKSSMIEGDKKQEQACELISKNLDDSQWIDGLGHEILLRRSAAPELLDIIRSQDCRKQCRYLKVDHLRKHVEGLCALFLDKDKSKVDQKRWDRCHDRFITKTEKPLPVIVFSNVRPQNASKFVIHLLLSMGHFNTEADLWVHGNMRVAFEKARLTPRLDNATDVEVREAVDVLLSAWIRDQLKYYPIGTKKFDELMISAHRILYSAVSANSIAVFETPPYYYTSLVNNHHKDNTKYKQECKKLLLEATLGSIERVYGRETKNIVPSEGELMNATKSNPLAWTKKANNTFPKTERQSENSYAEQSTIQSDVKKSINAYITCQEKAATNYLITGPPGAGKTHCLNHGIVYAISSGLFAMTTAVLADRAFLLGGQHFHKLFRLPVRDSRNPQRLAELAVISLQRKPIMLSLLRYLDVLFVDELGQLSAEMLSVLDIIMRRIRESSLFMGGVLVIGTLDQVQLRPIKGLPFLLSPYVLTTFSLGVLRVYVRCSTCKASQEINEIARFFTQDRHTWSQKLKRLEELLRENCTFVVEWTDDIISDDVLRVFPKREQRDKAIKNFTKEKRISNKKAIPRIETHTAVAEDVMVGLESHGENVAATSAVVSFLNWKCDEPKEIDLYKWGVYRFTSNMANKFKATQIGVIIEDPNPEAVKNIDEIPIMVAPAGVDTVDIKGIPKEDLLRDGWRETSVGAAPEYTLSVWSLNVKAKRKQYSLVPAVASTIHSAIGHTVNYIATELDQGSIWERAMVVVLLSRVEHARNIIFVGDKEANIRAVIEGLSKRNQYDDYMNHVVDVLESATSSSRPTMPLYLERHPYRPKDIPLPVDNTGFVYLLLSAKDGSSIYIGMTHKLSERLKQHNSGFGSLQTSPLPLRPWTLYAYVTGFGNNTKMMRSFESNWQNAVRGMAKKTPDAAAAAALSVKDRSFGEDSLVVVIGKES
ncbi:MAG: hypothetical protein SGILL_000742 [Bacillariaceae sp.]